MRGRQSVFLLAVSFSLFAAASLASCGYEIKMEKKQEPKAEEAAKPAQEPVPPEVVWEVVDPTQEKIKELEEKLKRLETKNAPSAPETAPTAAAPTTTPTPATPPPTAPSTTAAPTTASTTAPAKPAAPAKPKGYVRLYEHSGFSGQSVSSSLGNSIASMHGMAFNDKASSVQYKIPDGWKVILHADTGFGGRRYPLTGSGSISDLGSFGDKCSSLRWEGGP